METKAIEEPTTVKDMLSMERRESGSQLKVS
jgi:hypothetical protein